MLRLELDINGTPIGTIGVWNREEYNDDGEVRYSVYDLRGYKTKGGEISDYPKITDLWHDASDGAAALTARVMAEVPEERLDNL